MRFNPFKFMGEIFPLLLVLFALPAADLKAQAKPIAIL